MGLLWRGVKPLLFALDPERAHATAISIFKMMGAVPPLAGLMSWLYRAPTRPVTLWGRTFANPVGLAAGWDKDGLALRGLHTLGFSPSKWPPGSRLVRVPNPDCPVARR